MQYTVIFTPESQEQLLSLYRYIAAAVSPETAERNTTSSIVTYCESLQDFPLRGTRRDDVRPGLPALPTTRHAR
jgi:toxin ParE1/3/4